MGFPLVSFPKAETLSQYLSDHLCCLNENGVVSKITDLVAARFANRPTDEKNLRANTKMGVDLVIRDLQNGNDGYPGRHVVKLEGLPEEFWPHLAAVLMEVLISSPKVTTFPAKL